MRILGQPVEQRDLDGCMEPRPDGPASPDTAGHERARFRVMQKDTGAHVGTFVGLTNGSLEGAFWLQLPTRSKWQ
jgi:hypothetical protein